MEFLVKFSKNSLALAAALALVAANKIPDGKTLIGLLLYDAARRSLAANVG